VLAVVKSKPETGIEIMEVREPDIGRAEVMIEVEACGICGSDVHIYDWEPFLQWIKLPRILGHELSGTVCKVGEDIREFVPGDRVVADTWGGCGKCYYCRLGRFNHCMHQTRLGQHVDGGMAKFVTVPENSLYKIPAHVGFQEAALVEPLGVMLRAFERCDMKPGDDIAIIGPGPIGLLGVMISKANGASSVVVSGLAQDLERLEYAKKFGAVSVNAEEQNLRNTVLDLTEGKGVDIVLDVSGGKNSLSAAADIAKPGGQIGLVGLGPESVIDTNVIVEKELAVYGSFRRLPVTWHRAIKLLANNVIDVKSIITHVLPLDRAEEGFQKLIRKEGIKVVLLP